MTLVNEIQNLIERAEQAAQAAAEAQAAGRKTEAAEQRRVACLLFAQALELQAPTEKVST